MQFLTSQAIQSKQSWPLSYHRHLGDWQAKLIHQWQAKHIHQRPALQDWALLRSQASQNKEDLSVPSWHPWYRLSCKLSYWPGNISLVIFWASGPFLFCVLQRSGVQSETDFVILMWAQLSSHFPSQIPLQDMFLLHSCSLSFKQSYSFPDCMWPYVWLLSVM